MSKDDKQWVSGEIAKMQAAAEHRRSWQVFAWMKQHGSVGTFIGLCLGLLYFGITQHMSAVDHAVKQAIFETKTNERMDYFEADTKAHFEKIDNRLAAIETTLSNLQLTLAALRPLNAQTASTVVSVIKTAREQRQMLDAAVISDVGKHLLAQPAIPGSWGALGSLVAYRYAAAAVETAQVLPDCNDTLRVGDNEDVQSEIDPLSGKVSQVKQNGFMQDTGKPWMSHVFLGKCTLSIDDSPEFSNTAIGKFFAAAQAHHPGLISRTLVLSDVRITYHGGPVIPVTNFEFNRCTFELIMNQQPPARGQSLTRQLLAGNTTRSVVTLPLRS